MTERWATTERIFHAALERPVEERDAFLTKACAGDGALRRDVQSLLDQASAPAFLEQPALQVAAGLVTSASLAPLTGQQLGVYQIADLLGRGGMGEVYRARDTRLGREVAIKVLPRALTGDPDRRARLEREARVLASFNHPNIGMLHGLEESGGRLALVLELIEGVTLADRLARGPVPVKTALNWARQIAEALDAAHEKGIVHRDLKPANVKITPQDVVKVLDFGLARTFSDSMDVDEQTRSPTITMEGAVVGTAAYMSPEQARGQTVDKRADVWAFGCVLYELLTGQMAFGRATVSDTVSAVLQNEPDWTALPAGVPPAVTTLLRRCLDKDVRRRRRDIGDVAAEIDDALSQPASAASSDVSRHRAPAGRVLRLPVAVAAAIAALALGGVAGRWSFGAPAPAVGSSETSYKRITDAQGMEERPAVSPDGKDVAFVASVNGRRHIWVRRLAAGLPLQITQDDVDHDYPRWTADSSTIVYFTPPPTEGEAGTLWEIPALRGTPRLLATASTGADVSKDGRLATIQKTSAGVVLAILPRDGGAGQTIPIETTDTIEYDPPRWSPDNRSIAFDLGRAGWNYELFVVDLANRAPRVVSRGAFIKGVAWLPGGEGLVIASSTGSTMVYPPVFNLRVVPLGGGGERQLTFGEESYVEPEIVQPGRIFATRIRMRANLWRFPTTGAAAENVQNATQLTYQTGQVQTPSVSPDGREIAYLSDGGGHSNIWVAGIDGVANPRQLTSEYDDRVRIGLPIWSPVDDRIVYIRNERGGETVQTEWLINRDGSNRRLLAKDASSAAWSADGQWLYYQGGDPTASCIFKVRVDGNTPPERVRCNAAVPAPAPDGTLYFAPDGFQNANEIHKAKPENAEQSVPLARYATSRVPLWPTGFALSRDGRWLAVPLKDGGTTNIWAIPTDGGPYRRLTDFGQRSTLIARQVSWSADGKFIYAALSESEADIVLFDGLSPKP